MANNCGGTLNEKLTMLPTAEQSACTIYRVHKHLRNVNAKAYDPEVIAIGPYHHGKDNLKKMEKHKMFYLQSLLGENEQVLETYISAIEPLEQKARKCYAEPISLNATQFVEMLILDGCFIIELVRKSKMRDKIAKNDPIHFDWLIHSLQRDLMLFENQVPFFILRKLFGLIEVQNDNRLIHLLFCFFGSLLPGRPITSYGNLAEISVHLLDMIHASWRVSINGGTNAGNDNWRFMKSASELRVHNVRFEKNDRNDAMLFSLSFKNKTMFLSPLSIEDRTECLFRNLLVYEQYLVGTGIRFVTNYMKLLDSLIDSPKDVAILSENGIIDNWLGDDEVVANLVNKLADMIIGPGMDSTYADVFNDVDKHCKNRWNRRCALLRTKYFNGPWGAVSLGFAAALFLLTVTQTVFSILQVVL